MDIRQRPIVESSAQPPDINKIAISVQTEQKSTEILPGAFGCRESAHNEVIRLKRFDLQPVFRTALLIFTLLQLGDNAFKTVLLDGFEEFQSPAFDVISKANPSGVVRNYLAEDFFSLDEGRFH